MKVVSNVTRFYMEQNGQWYRIVTASLARRNTLLEFSETDVWKALEQVGFQKGAGAMTSEQDIFKGDFTYCQTLPVSRQEVDEDCAPPKHFSCRCAFVHTLPQGAFKTVEEMRQWMRNGCPM